MSFNIRIPNMTATSTADQIRQLHSYLFQMAEQLNWALNSIDTVSNYASTSADSKVNADAQISQEENSLNTFNDIKGLIIKSADIVNAYYEEIDNLISQSGKYVAESSFGTFEQETNTKVSANSKNIETAFSNIQQISTDVDEFTAGVRAYINMGELYEEKDGVPVYGIEVGQRTEKNGKEVFNKYARFTANKLSFYDSNGYEAAYISDKKLFIDNVEINFSFTMGGFIDTVQSDKSIVTKWVGGN